MNSIDRRQLIRRSNDTSNSMETLTELWQAALTSDDIWMRRIAISSVALRIDLATSQEWKTFSETLTEGPSFLLHLSTLLRSLVPEHLQETPISDVAFEVAIDSLSKLICDFPREVVHDDPNVVRRIAFKREFAEVAKRNWDELINENRSDQTILFNAAYFFSFYEPVRCGQLIDSILSIDPAYSRCRELRERISR